MSVINNRAKFAVVGALVADAAVNPMHWIYNGDIMSQLMENNATPEFRSEWAVPFYVQDVGAFSCYGDQTFCLLQSLAQNQGFNLQAYIADQYKTFGPDSKYVPNPSKEGYPKKGGWINGNIFRSLENLKNGKEPAGQDEAESDSFSKIISLVALYAGDKSLNAKIEHAVRTTLNNDKSVHTAQAYGQLLEECILTGSFDVMKWYESLPQSDVKDDVKSAIEKQDLDHVTASAELGKACALPGSFKCMVHCLLKCDDDYSAAVRMTLGAGGGNCARAIAVGALLAAKHGNVPESWVKKTIFGKDVLDLADRLVALRSA